MRALTDDEAWDQAQGLFEMWEPDMSGDAGEGLILQQNVFVRARDVFPRLRSRGLIEALLPMSHLH